MMLWLGGQSCMLLTEGLAQRQRLKAQRAGWIVFNEPVCIAELHCWTAPQPIIFSTCSFLASKPVECRAGLQVLCTDTTSAKTVTPDFTFEGMAHVCHGPFTQLRDWLIIYSHFDSQSLSRNLNVLPISVLGSTGSSTVYNHVLLLEMWQQGMQ